MYNEKIKNGYIDYFLTASSSRDIDKMRRSLVNLFNRLEEQETLFKKDFLQMDRDEIISLLSNFLRGGKDYQATTMSMLSQYFNWGLKEKLTKLNENVLIGLKISSLDVSSSYANSMVKNEQDLIDCLDTIYYPLEENMVDNLQRCFLMLAFTGIDTKDILMLKTDDIDLENSLIYYMNRKIEMSEYVRKVVRYVMEMTTMCKALKNGVIREIRIVRNGYVIENTINDASLEYRKSLKSTFNTSISAKLSSCERALTQQKIIDSGIFSRIYSKELSGHGIDCSEYLFNRRNNIKTIESPDRVADQCIKEYSIWKKAFNLD